jgi:hypothetical protein
MAFNFKVGDTVQNTITNAKGEILALADGKATVKYRGIGVRERQKLEQLIFVPTSDVDSIRVHDPAALDEFAQVFAQGGRIEISCSPDSVDKTAADISNHSSLSQTDAMDYIKVVTERSHAAKFDIILTTAVFPAELQKRFAAHNGPRAKAGKETQVGSKGLALNLLERGFMPEKI